MKVRIYRTGLAAPAFTLKDTGRLWGIVDGPAHTFAVSHTIDELALLAINQREGLRVTQATLGGLQL